MFFPLFAFPVFPRDPLEDSDIKWKQMLLEKENRYDKRTDCNLVCQYLYGNTYVQQCHRFITPNLTNYRDLYLSARGTGIAVTAEYRVDL